MCKSANCGGGNKRASSYAKPRTTVNYSPPPKKYSPPPKRAAAKPNNLNRRGK